MELWWEEVWVRGDGKGSPFSTKAIMSPWTGHQNRDSQSPGRGMGLDWLLWLSPAKVAKEAEFTCLEVEPQPSKHQLGWNCSTTPMGSAPGSDLSKVTEQSGAELGLTPRFPAFCPRVGRLPGQGRVAWLTPNSRQAASLSLMLVFFICKMERTCGSNEKKYKFLEPCRTL